MRLGKYEIIAQIGEGGLGEVYCARPTDSLPATLVAIKRLREQWQGRSDLAQLFASEADIGLRLSHPNIVRCFEIGFDENACLFLVMEYVGGKSLADLIDKLGPSQLVAYELSLHIVSKLLAGLHCAHEMCTSTGVALQLVHRDVTPDNVFLSFSGKIKLSDFGVAHLEMLDGSAAKTGAFGKLPYMAPEQVLEKAIDRRADVYSCGVICYELLTGTHPFVVDAKIDDTTLADHIVKGKYKRPRSVLPIIPVELEAIMEKAMAQNPESRYPTAQAFLDALAPLFRSNAHWDPVIAGLMRYVFPKEQAAFCELIK